MSFIIIVNFFTGHKISKRHNLLYETIGVLPEEIEAYKNIIFFMVFSILAMVICTLIEVISFCLYNNKLHPFKNILVISNQKTINNTYVMANPENIRSLSKENLVASTENSEDQYYHGPIFRITAE